MSAEVCATPGEFPRRGMNETIMYDLAIIGGGVNGAGIARDAAGRGLSVLLAEKDDLASATSSASKAAPSASPSRS